MTADTMITWYLEMTHRSEFTPAFIWLEDGHIALMAPDDLTLYRELYRSVGEAWTWRDRSGWSDEQLAEWLARAEIHVLYLGEQPVGYIELVWFGAAISIEYFGLVPAVHGRGLGKHLLSAGVQAAWDMGAERIILHTCNLDAPQALDNYQKRGFRIVRETQEPMPEAYR